MTIEGLSAGGTHPVQKAWVALDVPQCGFCQSGMIMAAAALLKEKPHPTDADTIDGVEDAAAAYAKVRNCVSGALDQLTGVAVINRALWVDAGAWWADWANSRFWVHAIGITFTALALMLGAPFWFDIIKRLTGLRKGPAGDT